MSGNKKLLVSDKLNCLSDQENRRGISDENFSLVKA